MQTELQLKLAPQTAASEPLLKAAVAAELGVPAKDVSAVVPLRRSIDARGRQVSVQLKVRAHVNEAAPPNPEYSFEARDVSNAPEAIVIGAGPAGLFAALQLIEQGIKPVILERGKDVKARRRDLVAINREHVVDPDSNYCFGEGGAGTYSDGKLYTRSTKRGNVRKVLELLVAHGADPDILVNAHPHIGTNKLPGIITNIREQILACGGVVHFESRVTRLLVKEGQVTGVELTDGNQVLAQAVILATGHSARDIFRMLHQQGITIEAKPFALGVRAEHPQSLIDRLQYHREERGELLPPASYSLVHQAGKNGVYSFCMCPGGIIAPCATQPGEVVTNGWSPSKRNNPYANSGIVVSIDPEKLKRYQHYGPLAGLEFQAEVEQTAWKAGGETQVAPAQRLLDFTEGRTSSTLPENSYIPGTTAVNLKEVLPPFVHRSLQEGFRAFGRKMRGYLTNEALVVGVESRTSSPVRIPRDPKTLQHPEVKGLFPCGEGAGYAGGIASAAIDGQRCAMEITTRALSTPQ